jgi:putative ABC transport system ATP-binding protein
MSFIEIENLKFSYSQAEPPVLQISNLKIERGEKVFLFGPSGTGKTTLLEVLAGILKPDDGHLVINGTKVNSLSEAGRDRFRSKNIGYIFQSFNLIAFLSVRENILLPVELRRDVIDEKRFQHLTETLGIASILDSPVSKISVGQQQRVAVARALLGKPQLVLADEPTSALDYDAREKFLKLLFQLCEEENITLIFVSHDRSLQDLFSRKINLSEVNKGRV